MERERNVRKIAVSFLVISILCLSVAFAMLSRKLSIAGSAKLDPTKWGVKFVEGTLKSVTFSRTSTGKWFVSILVEKNDEPKNKNGKAIGIDWNCRDDCFLTLSDGTKVKCPRFLREKEYHRSCSSQRRRVMFRPAHTDCQTLPAF